jgi:hypothetical protein
MRTTLALICLLATPAFAKDGNWLVEVARSHERIIAATDYRQVQDEDYPNAREYMAYVQGVFDTHGLLAAAEVIPRPFYCAADNVTVGQITAVVGKYLKENPDKWSMNASTLTMKALHDAFPCGK